MKNYLLIYVLLFCCFSCATEDGINPNVTSESELNGSSSLNMLLSIQVEDSSYIVTHQIDSIEIRINDSLWGYFESTFLDTSVVEKNNSGNYFSSEYKMEYLVMGTAEEKDVTFSTAGDYARYLNGIEEIKPGTYICLIRSFVLTDLYGKRKKYYPMKYVPFTIESGEQSIFIGSITLEINE